LLDRALLVLAPALPELTWGELSALSIGQRNTCLFALRQHTFGSALRARAVCPVCGGALEFNAAVTDLCDFARTPTRAGTRELRAAGYTVAYRLLDSRDLARAVDGGELAAARARLIQACVVRAHDGVRDVPASELPAEVVAALADEVSAADPQADVRVALACPHCGHEWTLPFDIGPFLWTEIDTEARRLLTEVHTLARAYGWNETEILAMSAARRQLYLEMVT
jgi:hypothetical protein